METIEYQVAGHFLSAIINGDDSGLEPQEVELLESWYQREMLDGNWILGVDGGDSYFAECEVCEQYADCYTLTATRI